MSCEQEKETTFVNFGIVPKAEEEAVIYMCVNIQKVLYKSKFDALSIRTRRIALKRTRSFTNISLGESSPNSFVLLYKKKRRTSPWTSLSTTKLREIEISIGKVNLSQPRNRNSLSLSFLYREIKQISISSNHETNS